MACMGAPVHYTVCCSCLYFVVLIADVLKVRPESGATRLVGSLQPLNRFEILDSAVLTGL
jgi:hypothetical protein